jgi:hypothetical protein
MKKGKTSKIIGFRNAKIIYGTVDSINFKSLYINIQTWVCPKENCENWERAVLNTGRAIKHSILNSNNTLLFDNKFISDLDLRSSGLVKDKKSFLNLEITLFLNKENIDFKSKIIKDSIKKICKTVFNDNFDDNDYFTFHLTKSEKNMVLD